MLRILILAAILLALPGCKATYQSDKTRIVTFTFGFGFTVYSSKEVEAKFETKDKTGEEEK